MERLDVKATTDTHPPSVVGDVVALAERG